MSPEQRLTPVYPVATAAPELRLTSRTGLSAEELAALREIWSTPLRPEPPVPRPAILH